MSLERKLNPPQIEVKLPAFCGSDINIPFTLTRAVSPVDFNKIAVIVKSVQTNIEKLNWITPNFYYDSAARTYKVNININKYNEQFFNLCSIQPSTGTTLYIKKEDGTFEVTDTYIDGQTYICTDVNKIFTPLVGQYYKVQIALVNKLDDVPGYYSIAGVIKCTSAPKVYIKGLDESKRHSYTYTGVYSQEGGDTTEKVYNYRFNLYNDRNELIATSGELSHNSTTDKEPYYSIDEWTVRRNLDANINYEIEYVITTTNGLKQSSGLYQIIESETKLPNVHGHLSAKNYFEDGYVKIDLVGDKSGVFVNGKFILVRSSSEDNFESWYELTKFDLSQWDSSKTKMICKDYTVKQGIQYIYAIRAYNSVGLFSDRLKNIEGPVKVDFEDSFLYDGERQLKIRFNPKVSSFKSTVLETKTDTIGGKFPFVFRNGNVEYKEFPISGLISFMGDENNEFLANLDPNEYDFNHWLTADNIRKEREFKMLVLSWLTNGKPKLFRSPTEGNFIIRTTNVSLTPNDVVGRMLHTFNCTAYEIAEFNFDNLKLYGFAAEDYVEMRTMRINQISLSNPPADMYQDGVISLPSAVYASITATPGTTFRYTLNSVQVSGQEKVGNTGQYVFPEEVLLATPLISIELLSGSWGDGATLTYGYYDTTADNFSLIHNISISDQMIQLIGEGIETNLINHFEDIRLTTGAFHYIRVQPRQTTRIYLENGIYYLNNSKDKITTLNPTMIYFVYNGLINPKDSGEYIDGRYEDISLAKRKKTADLSYDLHITGISQGEIVDFNGNAKTSGRYEALTNLSSVKEIYAGEGLIFDIVYQQKETIYVVEVPGDHYDSKVGNAKNLWIAAKDKYDTMVATNAPAADLKAQKAQIDSTYATYVYWLEQSLNELQEEYGVEYAL